MEGQRRRGEEEGKNREIYGRTEEERREEMGKRE